MARWVEFERALLWDSPEPTVPIWVDVDAIRVMGAAVTEEGREGEGYTWLEFAGDHVARVKGEPADIVKRIEDSKCCAEGENEAESGLTTNRHFGDAVSHKEGG